jgi:parallel beta-helix repeat protein
MTRLLAALAAATSLLAASAGQAVANHVACGDVITQDTTLDGDVGPCPGNGILIAASNVTLDLNGHTLSGQGSGRGISMASPPPDQPWQNVDVHSGAVRNFGGAVYIRDADRVSLADLDISGSFSAIAFSQGSSALIRDNAVTGNTDGIAIGRVGNVTIANNVLKGNRSGIGAGHAFGVQITDNRITDGGSGINDATGTDARMTGNYVADNQDYGISFGPEMNGEVADNDVLRNGGDGITTREAYVEIDRNRADRNGGDGIHIERPFEVSVTDNHTWFNGNLGIEAVPGVSGGGNWAKHNGNPAQCAPTALCSTTGKPKG